MNAFSSPQEPFSWPVSHGMPDSRMLARAQALRHDADEIAWRIGQTPAYQRAVIQSLISEHTGLMLRAMAAEMIAAGNMTLARNYIATALRMEKTA